MSHYLRLAIFSVSIAGLVLAVLLLFGCAARQHTRLVCQQNAPCQIVQEAKR